MEKKFPEADPHFYEKVRGACKDDYERGMVFILQHTGMHLGNLVALTPDQLDRAGHIHWRRGKTGRPMRSLIPAGDQALIKSWIARWGHHSRTTRSIEYRIAEIGDRAGFPRLAPTTFRTQRGCTLLDEGWQPHEVCHILGCKLSTLMDHYAVLKDDRRTLGRDA